MTWTIEGFIILKPFIQDGRLRPLAVTTAKRLRAMPDLPTMAEAGITGYDFTAWAGIGAPAVRRRRSSIACTARSPRSSQPRGARLVQLVRRRSRWRDAGGPCRAGARRARQAGRGHSRHRYQGRVGPRRSWRARHDAPKGSDDPDSPCPTGPASLLLILVMVLGMLVEVIVRNAAEPDAAHAETCPLGASSCAGSQSTSRQP